VHHGKSVHGEVSDEFWGHVGPLMPARKGLDEGSDNRRQDGEIVDGPP